MRCCPKLLLAALVALLPLGCRAQKNAEHWSIEVVKEHPHDTGSYTQGLFFHEGRLYETTGLNGKSTLRVNDLATGKAQELRKFSRKYFAEGSVVLGDRLYVLTWTNKVVFVYDPETLEYRSTWSYPREGWGLTTDGRSLIASDGSSKLYFMNPDLKVEKTLTVTLNGRPLRLLNELEWIDGKIWANIYTTDSIAVIDPKTGVVEALIDCSDLLPESLRTQDTDVLNGIAVLGEGRSQRIFLTGKNWPRLYEVRIVKK
ncbi:MAG: glutaminyl-peptide cyclotransferase [Candidatus Cryptobacteroides sp.]